MDGFFASGPCSAQLNAIHRISSALFAKADVDTMLLETLEVSMQTADAEAGSILLLDRNTKQLVFRHALGPVGSQLVGQAVNLDGTGKCATVYRTGVSDISVAGFDEPPTTRESFPTRSTLTTAIRNFGGDPIGVVQVLNKRSGPFDTRDKELLEIVSAMAATVIDYAQRAEERKQAALARVLAFLGHDLKNQSFIITSVLENPDIYPDAMTIIKGANAKAERLALAMNEYAKGKNLFEFVAGDLKSALELELAELVLQAVRWEHKMDLSGIKHVPAFPFDAVFVGRAVFNLVHNAGGVMVSSKKGETIQVSTSYHEDGQFPNGNFVEITVSDNGPGMPQEKLRQILMGEAQPDPNKAGSTGTGTRIVYYVAQTHDGLFLGESEVGKGTTFHLRLPMKR